MRDVSYLEIRPETRGLPNQTQQIEYEETNFQDFVYASWG